MGRFVLSVSVLFATAGLASDTAPGWYGPLPTLWEELESADAVVVGTLVDVKGRDAVLAVEERLKGDAPDRLGTSFDSSVRQPSSGVQVVALLFKAERAWREIERRNPEAKSTLDQWRKERPSLTVERQMVFSLGERSRVTGLLADALTQQRQKGKRTEAFGVALLRLETTNAAGMRFFETTGFTAAARDELRKRVLARSADLFATWRMMEQLQSDADPALTDAYLDSAKRWMTAYTRGVAVAATAPLEVLARRVDPALTRPRPSGGSLDDRDAASREWLRLIEERWKATQPR